MVIPRILFLVIIVLSVSLPRQASAQVDQQWLKSWREAEGNAPEKINAKGRIADTEEPGIPLVIHGQVFLPDGSTPAPDVIVHSYHRDHHGYEFGHEDSVLTTWGLQGWVKTDFDGRFEFLSIRPAIDQLGREGAHIHFTVVSADHGRQWANKAYFSDDRLITDQQFKKSKALGKFGMVHKVEIIDGVQHLTVNIRLKEKADF